MKRLRDICAKPGIPAEFSLNPGVKTSQCSNKESASSDRLEPLLNEYDVARLTRMSVAAIRRWRLLNSGPPFLKVGSSSVRYDPRALRVWLASRPAGGEHVAEATHE